MATGDWIVRKLQELDQSVQDIRSTQLGHSSLQGEDSIRSYDADGNLSLVIGAQDDGTHAVQYVQGPPPLPPTPPLVTVDGPVVRVAWDGLLAGGDLPLDFARVDVHFAEEGEDLFDEDAVKANLNTTSGSEAVLMASETGTYRVALVARSQSRASSEPSEITEVEVSLVGLEGVIDSVVDNARGGKNHYTPTPPEGTDFDPERDLWFDTSEDDDGLVTFTAHRWDPDAQEWVSIGDQRIDALADAQDDFEADLDDVRQSVDGKTTIRWSPDAPSAATPGNAEGDTWFQYGDGRQKGHWRWDGSTWVKQDFDPVMIPALDIGTGTFGDLDGIRIKARTISAEKLLIGGDRNLLPNGDLSAGSAVGWPNIATYATEDPPPGHRGYVTWPAIATAPQLAHFGRFPVSVGDMLIFEVWIKADKPDSRTFIEARDQNGSHIATGQSGKWSPEGWTNGNSMYPVGNAVVPTEWTLWRSRLKITSPDTTDVRLAALYLNHSNGSERGATLSLGGMRLFKAVGSTLLEPGSVTTDHILAGSITAESGIISSIDLGVATVGYLHGSRIEAETIDTPQLAFGAATGDILSVDALNFKTALGLTVRSGAFYAGDAVEITEDFGIRQFGPDGALNVSLPSDGSEAEFRGDISARSFTATGRMTVQGPGTIASGGELEMESGVTAPVTPPTLTTYTERTPFPPLEGGEEPSGIAWAGGHWWRAVNVAGTSEGDRVEKIDPEGELVDSFTTHGDPRGITAIGDELFVLGKEWGVTTVHRVWVYDLDGALLRDWEYQEYGSGTYAPGIGTDGTNVIIAQCWRVDGRLTWRTYRPSNGALLSEVDSTDRVAADVVGVLRGTFDYGTERVAVATGKSSGAVHLYQPNGAPVAYGGWHAGPLENVVGMVWTDGAFHHMTLSGNLMRMSAVKYPAGSPGPDTNDWWAAVTWADGDEETPIGPPRRFTYMRRTDLRLSLSTPPMGAKSARIYLARGATEPPRTDFHRVLEADATEEQATVVLPGDWETGAVPPGDNTFDDSTPGLIRSTLGQFWVDGTGAGRWGPLTFHPDGSMTSNQVPEWVPVTSFRTGFGPQSWGFVPEYRVWPDGKVEWRGVIAGAVTERYVTALTVPVVARPSQPVNLLATTNDVADRDATTRIEFGQLNEPDALRIYRGSVNRTWVSLDAVSYYLE